MSVQILDIPTPATFANLVLASVRDTGLVTEEPRTRHQRRGFVHPKDADVFGGGPLRVAQTISKNSSRSGRMTAEVVLTNGSTKHIVLVDGTWFALIAPAVEAEPDEGIKGRKAIVREVVFPF